VVQKLDQVSDMDGTFEWLNKAYQEHPIGLYSISFEPYYDPLRSDPRFRDLLRRMNLPLDSSVVRAEHN